ncbi:MAG TPA: chaperone modulator CbpM [Gammaproteobacteria bacterium]|nr:chaperone modulator CbpM [Gammaproteobacteria bacterium]
MSRDNPLIGVLLDESLTLTLHELCEYCGVEESVVIEMVREGIAEPIDDASTEWQFTGRSVARIRIAYRLRRDLEVNMAGAALALELLEEIETLRKRR